MYRLTLHIAPLPHPSWRFSNIFNVEERIASAFNLLPSEHQISAKNWHKALP